MDGNKRSKDCVKFLNRDGVSFVQFENLRVHQSVIAHGFTTRKGGVSTGDCSGLNLGLNRNDSRENVLENFKRICDALHIGSGNLVLTHQVHGSRIVAVDEGDRGKGLYRESDIRDCDGLITDRRKVALTAFFADCVPVLFFDPARQAIGVVHSGWRGTVKKIAVEAVNRMKEAYSCDPADILAAIGPSIGKCCFEVGNEVYREFMGQFEWAEDFCQKGNRDKWYIDLTGIIQKSLMDCGLREDHICAGNLCTKCGRDIFFSHRGDNGKTGSLAAIIQLL